LVPAIDGKIPVLVVAQRVKQIRDALAWGKEENLKLVLAGAKDGWRIAGEIASSGVPVIVEQPIELPSRADEPYAANFTNAAALAKAGVRIAFSDGSNASNARNLTHQAAAAVAFGFPREKALAAMTLEPAAMLGVADRVGSLEPGKDATLI